MLNIRNAGLSDVGSLHELYMKHLTQHPPTEPQDISKWSELLKKLVKTPDYHLLVGETEGRVTASVTIVIIRNLRKL